MEHCSQNLNWVLTGAGDFETVSLRLSLVTASIKMVFSSAVEGHCGHPMKAKINQGVPVRTRLPVPKSKKHL